MSLVMKTVQLGKILGGRGLPSPLSPFINLRQQLGELQMLKRANRTATTRYDNEEGDYIVVRAEITKKEHQDLTRNMSPQVAEQRNISELYQFMDKFFDLVVLEWSLVDEDDKAVPVSLQAYYDLDTESATVIDTWLQEHMRVKFGKEVDELEGEATS